MEWLYSKYIYFLLFSFDLLWHMTRTCSWQAFLDSLWHKHLRALVGTDRYEQREREKNRGNNAWRMKKGMYRESDPCFPVAACLYPQSVKEHLSVLVGHLFPCFLSSVSSCISVLDAKHCSLLSFLSFSTSFNKLSNNKTCGANSLVRIRTGWFGTKERENKRVA